MRTLTPVALFENEMRIFLEILLLMCIIWMSKQLCITSAKRLHAYTHIHIFLFVIIWVLVNLNISCGGRDGMLYEVCCSSNNRGLYVTVHSSSPFHLSQHIVEKLLLIIYTNPVRTSQETHYVSATKPNRLMLFRETVAVYWENHTEHTDTPCAQNAGF
jgi:hypothetical protein